MRAITKIGVIIAVTGGVILAAHRAASETERQADRRPLVLLPASMNAGAGLRLASHGVAKLLTDDGLTIAVLHLRAEIANTTRDQPWALDASKPRVELASGQIGPAFVNSDVPTLPITILDPGERRTIDFYFPLRSDLADRGGPMGFTVTWAINAPARIVRIASFDRTAWFNRPTAVPSECQPLAGWGQHWWFDPSYPWPTYRHGPGIITSRPPSHVVVISPPRWEEELPDAAQDDPYELECDQW
jgi:hypothetical protein